MILVIGATGMLGGEICRQLTAEGKSVRAMIRTTSEPGKIAELIALGIDLKYGDLRDPSSFSNCLSGVQKVISTVSSMPFSYVSGENDIQSVDLEGMQHFIDTANRQGVEQFIYTSFSENFNVDFPLKNAKRRVEKHLKSSGMVYTILRPSCFMEVWLSPAVGFDIENARISIYGEGTKPVSYISYKDVAKFAVKSLVVEDARNNVLELGGPRGISQLEAVSIFEHMGNENFEVQFVSEESLEMQRKTVEDPMQQSFAGLMQGVARGDMIYMEDMADRFHINLTSLEKYSRQSLVPV